MDNYTINPTHDFTNVTCSVTSTNVEKAKPFILKSTKRKLDKKQKEENAREFYAYMKRLYNGAPIIQSELKEQLETCYKSSQTTVTTHLLYAADLSGLNRPDIVKAAIPILLTADYTGKLFLHTFVRGLIWHQNWKLICEFIRDETPAKLRTVIFESIKHAILKGNKKCMQALPRQGTIANRIRGYLNLKPAEWRHILAEGSQDNLPAMMSSGDWGKIKYENLSVYVISACYRAFERHDRARFNQYLQSNEKIAKTARRIKFHFRKPKFNTSSAILKNYFVKIIKKDHKCKTSV